jgi:Rps23 Pro-64 3,4-dihydroxylase Tpa1-like proline 4-hydroxylase
MMHDLAPDGAITDGKLHAAGLGMMPPGGWLDLHLDASMHPNGWRRAINLILFLDPWEPSWGGALEFWAPNSTGAAVSILPAENRLVAFECNDASYHGIPDPISPFAKIWRRTLSVFFYRESAERKRAVFVGRPGENDTAEVARWRSERATCLDGR